MADVNGIPVINVSASNNNVYYNDVIQSGGSVPAIMPTDFEKIGDYYAIPIRICTNLTANNAKFNKQITYRYMSHGGAHRTTEDGSIDININDWDIYYDYMRECVMIHDTLVEMKSSESFDSTTIENVTFGSTYINPSVSAGGTAASLNLTFDSVPV